ncbi:MAG: Nucleotidyltransferase/DNA polymerase involved in DNA repair [Candidatus Woesebacteria bacterium GW2011_GWC2_47_16]|nr:MAG: Nucleotidyltransferase/DNA polymerase involved in DNA repair [Candidatus Woesebacteria bacterium GW2011_GWE1_45_18]KKU25006.1 MAG: Nucleotidyltransferase/DNA polymerase involved in DNA repair [Candidatus Woesebacteria bacterium GW2011_GWF1_46_13]KKU47814.1 MAG: Nucleotidyltransferase/DNA polymerase involved in DNA repair [Candidatus Woesebacteria bacterium GW2011_GWF2_46_8]KKU65281.1 MAG: Nucleotidyltransferase/DNA polymerase involved in DNA repair [Candidatus Woesebacteria bacterium GW2
MHLDLNSCFATIEQQANPHLRGKPVAVAAYDTPSGCIVAPSIEAKTYGVKVGMRVKEGKALCPSLIVLPPDPWKYRNVHLGLRKILGDYTDRFYPKSIDEFALNLEDYPAYAKGMFEVGREIKMRIKREIGEWITVSIGIAPNRFLAKTAAGLHKPDGLDEINKDNFQKIYSGLSLTDLCGIKVRNAARLNSMGIYTVLDFYRAPYPKLKAAFESVLGYYWYLRLRGREIDDVIFGRKSYGNSFALPKPLTEIEELSPVLAKLVEKMGRRVRTAGYKAQGVHLAISYRDGNFWHKGVTVKKELFDSRDIYKVAFKLLTGSPYRSPVRDLAVSVFNLLDSPSLQLELFDNLEKKEKLIQAVDAVNERWGNFVITPARMLGTKEVVIDRIAFGGVKELEEFTTS